MKVDLTALFNEYRVYVTTGKTRKQHLSDEEVRASAKEVARRGCMTVSELRKVLAGIGRTGPYDESAWGVP